MRCDYVHYIVVACASYVVSHILEVEYKCLLGFFDNRKDNYFRRANEISMQRQPN